MQMAVAVWFLAGCLCVVTPHALCANRLEAGSALPDGHTRNDRFDTGPERLRLAIERGIPSTGGPYAEPALAPALEWSARPFLLSSNPEDRPSHMKATRPQGVTLGIQGDQFTINGTPAFLLGISYYGGLGATTRTLSRDMAKMGRYGFNWMRVWATWESSGDNVSAVDVEGRCRQPYMDRLVELVRQANERGIVVDVTLTRGPLLPTFEAHKDAVRLLAETLNPFRNVYFDPANENSVRGRRYVSVEELAALCQEIRSVDPGRLITTSGLGPSGPEEVRRWLDATRVDFVSPHLSRKPDSPRATAATVREFRAVLRDVGHAVPVHLQEPFRRGYQPRRWDPSTADFALDLEQARAGGAAGWCFHNGDQKDADDGRPRRSFDLRTQSLFEQLDAEERQFLRRLTE